MATEYIGSWFATILDLVVILDAMALALAICVTIGRGFFALGRDGLLPSVFTRTSRYGTPWVGNLVVAIGGIGLMLLSWLADYGSRLVLAPDDVGQPRADPPRRVRDVHPLGHDRLARGRARLPDPRASRRSGSCGRRATSWWQYAIVAIAVRRRCSAISARSSPSRTTAPTSTGRPSTGRSADRLVALLWFVILMITRREERRQRRRARGRAPRRAAARRDARLPSSVVDGGSRLARRRPRRTTLPEGALRQVEAGGRAVCVGRIEGEWVAFDDTCTHEECSLAEGELDGHGRRLPVPRLRVRRAHGRRAHPARARAAPDLRGARGGRARCSSGSRRPPAGRRGRARARRPRPGRDGGAPRPSPGRRSTGSRSTMSTSPTSTCGSSGCRYDWLALLRRDAPLLLAARERGPRASGRSRATTTSSRSRRTGRRSRTSSAARRCRTSRRRSSRRASRCSTPTRRLTRACGRSSTRASRRGSINAYEERIRELARGILDAAFAQRGVRLGGGRRRRDPDVGLLRDHGPARRRPEADHRARRQDPRQHRPGRRRRGVRRRAGARDPELRMLPFSSPFSLDLIEYGRALGEARRHEPRDDITTRLVEAELDGSRLDEQEFGTFFILLTTAGNETTRHTISLGLDRPPRAPGRAPTPRRRPVARAAPRPTSCCAGRIPCTTSGAPRPVTSTLHGRRDRGGRQGRHLVRGGELRRGEVRRPVPLRRRSHAEPPPDLRPRRAALLPRRAPREAGGQLWLEEMIPYLERIELDGEPMRLRSNFFNGIKRLPVRVAA